MAMVGGRPTAIAGFVIPIVVDAVERVLLAGALPHVGEEIVEDEPTLATLDAATAVPSELSGFRVEAPLFHPGPRIVGWGWAGFMHGGMAVPGLGLPFSLEASATGCMPSRQIVADSNDLFPTITEAAPSSIGVLRVRKSQNDKAAKTLTGEVFETSQAGGSYL